MLLKKSFSLGLFLLASVTQASAMEIYDMLETSYPGTKALQIQVHARTTDFPVRTTDLGEDQDLTKNQKILCQMFSQDLERTRTQRDNLLIVTGEDQKGLFRLNFSRWLRHPIEEQDGQEGNELPAEYRKEVPQIVEENMDEDESPKTILWHVSPPLDEYLMKTELEVGSTQYNMALSQYVTSFKHVLNILRKSDWVYFSQDFPESMHQYLSELNVSMLISNPRYTLKSKDNSKPYDTAALITQ